MSSVAIKGGRFLVTGGAGTIGSTIVDQLVAGGARSVTVLDNFVRGRRENLSAVADSDTLQIVDGDICDRQTVDRLTRGVNGVFHLAALRITQCAEEPRLANEVLVNGTFNVVEAAAAHGVEQGGRLLVGLGVRPRGALPHVRGPPPLRQRHHLRRGQGVQRGPAAQLSTR